ncbi:hypothetical protein OSSY52_20890 [Tepiditoga spiralis]|uniref:Peptidase MA-like domain-containing protein n=1 Tax=Tepiditoga spiralis TaxID=2108365 RepID=A0A7G1G5T1_9BACT|nr:hypothetical protein [Tepiditoga spiralis]BBE31948.1 hypothetical protein OSSY52_20890 [Tepiditoga spiralis]
MKDILFLKFRLLFIIIFILIFFPITIIVSDKDSIKLYSTGINLIVLNTKDTFKSNTFFFYKKIPYFNYAIINFKNSFLRFSNEKFLIQKQSKYNSAYVYFNKKFYKYKNFYSDKKWILSTVDSISNILKKLSIPTQNLFFVYTENRSFHINPNVMFVNSKKDIAHEYSHYYFGNLIEHSSKDTWHEILCETNSLLYLKRNNMEEYLNEANLKTIGYYKFPYGKNILEFIKRFNYNFDKIIDFESFLTKNFKKLNDKKFNSILKKEEFK